MHTAIIMDGNGRWAVARGRPRSAGHRAGAAAVRRVVEAAPGLGIGTLTLYAFSADNWQRPAPEVSGLMRLMGGYLRAEAATCAERGIRLSVIGRRDRLPAALRVSIAAAEAATAHGTRLHLRLAVDYSARDAIVRAACSAPRTREELECSLAAAQHEAAPAPPVDLLVRTGGEQRLSDFMLWECAYAELYFTPMQWPDFDAGALAAALSEYGRRQRRFGGLAAVAS